LAFCSTTRIAIPSSPFIFSSASKISLTSIGASPSDGSSSRTSFGRATIARPSASICCSPPESVPACCPLRSSSRGKYLKTRCASSLMPPRRVYAPSRRFSQTESSLNVPRPSGTCAIPARAAAPGRRGSFLSSKITSPLRRTVPETARSVVVLPAPFAPSTATSSPSPTSSEIPCRAFTGP
jgi:hypothetical protein